MQAASVPSVRTPPAERSRQAAGLPPSPNVTTDLSRRAHLHAVGAVHGKSGLRKQVWGGCRRVQGCTRAADWGSAFGGAARGCGRRTGENECGARRCCCCTPQPAPPDRSAPGRIYQPLLTRQSDAGSDAGAQRAPAGRRGPWPRPAPGGCLPMRLMSWAACNALWTADTPSPHRPGPGDPCASSPTRARALATSSSSR